jgi:hypothetical protein
MEWVLAEDDVARIVGLETVITAQAVTHTTSAAPYKKMARSSPGHFYL